MTTVALKKIISEQVNELSQTVNQLEKKAKKVLKEGTNSRTLKDVSKRVKTLSDRLQKEPLVQLLLKVKDEAVKRSSDYWPVSRKEFKNLEKKLSTLDKKVDHLKSPNK